jgi:hypothetical protein
MHKFIVGGGIFVLVAACATEPMFVGTVGGNLSAGLIQRVSVSNAMPRVGDSITIRSVVMNRSGAPITVASMDGGGLGLTGVAFEQRGTITPIGIWMAPLAPGDSIVTEMTTTPITAAPGEYQLHVQHLSSPGRGVDIPIRVQLSR